MFEIGSITKILTALLLADMVERGEVVLDDPVATYLPAAVTVPDYHGQPITLLDLATYTSGLPRLPGNFAPADPLNPYVDYTVEQLYAFLSGYTLTYAPGTHYEYANVGFGLLGHALARRADRSYEDLLIQRICNPLGLDSTRITLSPEMQTRMAQGHDDCQEPTPLWDLPSLPGAGAVRSSADDLLVFLEACLGRRATPLAPAMARLLATRRPTNRHQVQVGLGWFMIDEHDDAIVTKTGGTGGFATFVGFSPGSGRGAIVLTNAANSARASDIGQHLINASYPLSADRKAVAIKPAILARYAGTYELSPTFAITVRVRGARLFVQATNQREYEAFAESDTTFFLRIADAQISFETTGDGPAAALVLHQNGRDHRGART